MKITHNKIGQKLNISDLNKANETQKTKNDATKSAINGGLNEASSSTQMSISARAQDIQKAKELAKKAPDVREDRVAALQKAIDNGSYNVSAKDIADKMVDEELQWS